MPVRAVTTRFMYKGLCTIPDVLTYRTPVNLPEDEVEGESSRFQVFIVVITVHLHATSTWKTSSGPWRALDGVRFSSLNPTVHYNGQYKGSVVKLFCIFFKGVIGNLYALYSALFICLFFLFCFCYFTNCCWLLTDVFFALPTSISKITHLILEINS